MAFSDFQYPDVLGQLHLTEKSESLFETVPAMAPSLSLRTILPNNLTLATLINTEKARSELLVSPIFSEIWGRFPGKINFSSGVEFSADPAHGLSGYVDFLLGIGNQLPRISAPLIAAFEAKRDNIANGYGQCIAAMVGIERFNAQSGKSPPLVYGCVTTGSIWKFLRLSSGSLTFDLSEYSIHQIDKLLGIFAYMLGQVPPAN